MGIGDLFGVNHDASWWARDLMRASYDEIYKHKALNSALTPNGSDRWLADMFRRNEALVRASQSDLDRSLATGAAADLRRWQSMMPPSIYQEAIKAAELTRAYHLPAALEIHRSPVEEIALKLLRSPTADFWHSQAHLSLFSAASSISDLYAGSTRATCEVFRANSAMMLEPIGIGSVAEYRTVLDAAGLILPRWPRVRLLTRAEKRRRFKALLNENVEPPYVRKAKSLVHRYELTFRRVLDDAMAGAYGENWPDERLPHCDCKDLLGKWKRREGDVLDHADYAHYARIVSHPDHFADIFQTAFEDAEEAYKLLITAGRLRARSHHPHDFRPEDLRDLRLTWRTIENALTALDEYDFSY